MNFEDYLRAKRIDDRAFEGAEPALFSTWKSEFAQMHPNSFTLQKLNLINPIRRKYRLASPSAEQAGSTPPPAVRPGKPVIKPKPKIS